MLWHGKEIPDRLPSVQFNADRHEYQVDGRIWPNVTGFLPDRFDNGDKTAALWGEAAHDHMFHLVKGTLTRSMVTDQRMELTLQGFEKGLRLLGIELPCECLAECIIYSRRFHFIGRFDFLFALKNFDLVTDFKTGTPSEQETRKTGAQLGGYIQGIIEHGLSTLSRLRAAEVNVQLDGTVAVREWRGRELREITNVFLALVTAKNYFKKL